MRAAPPSHERAPRSAADARRQPGAHGREPRPNRPLPTIESVTPRCTAVRADEALPALRCAVTDAKAGSPLAPVTIIVPTNAVGVTARRWLGANGGVAAIELVTPSRLAERLVGADLAESGRRPVSTPLIDITVRNVLRDVPGAYSTVAEHPSTVTSLRDLYREVRIAGPDALRRLAEASARGREAAGVLNEVATRLAADWYDEADLFAAAIEQLDTQPPTAPVIAFLPRPEPGWPAGLLRALADLTSVDLLAETTGIAAVDDEARRFATAVGGELPPDDRPATAGHAVSVLSTTDADDEVRHAVRRLVDAARGGTPLARTALLWPTDRPYARLVEHHLDAAGVPWNGRPGTLVTERLVPRFLLDLLQLDRRGLRRNDLFDLLADLPLRDQSGERISVGRWERLARAAGVSRDEHWEPRLHALAAAYRARPEPREDDAVRAEQLATFVADLRRDLGPAGRTRTWKAWAEWCERQVLRRLGRSVLDQLDEAERLASDHANKVLDRLRHLDALGPPVTRAEFRAAFAAEFDVAPGRLGRLGDGVMVGSLAGTVGLDADLTIVLGAADGLLPPAPVVDPLVSDHDLRAAGLPGSDSRTHRIHRSLLGHLATSATTVISVPRGDLRATTDRLPSRWIGEHAADAPHDVVDSHHAGLLSVEFPASHAEHRLRRRLTAATSDRRLADACAGDDAAVRALAMRTARRSDSVTEFDGDLSSLEIGHFPRPVSASQIESWPACPHGYFVRYLLGVRPLDDPTDEAALSPIERGNVVHETLDRFHRLVVAGELEQPGPNGWSSEHVVRLESIFDEVADEFERTGRTGRAAHWFLDRRSVRDDLLTWFELDGRTAAARNARVVHSELRFGYDEDVALPLPDGRRIPVAGFVDRIDEQPGGALVVMDHKSGGATKYSRVDATDPTEGATRFQLPIYAAAALAQRGEQPGESATRVLAEYDFFAKGRYARHGYTLDESVWKQVMTDLGEVVAGIESGLYPAVTEPPKYQHFIDCHYCQPDGLGVEERYDEWNRKRHDPRLARWFPPDDEQDPGDRDRDEPDGAT